MRVRRADLEVNDRADEAADLGQRRRLDEVATARRICTQACHRWYPLVLHLRRILIAAARIGVNHDPGSGTAPDPVVLSVGARLRKQGCRKPPVT